MNYVGSILLWLGGFVLGLSTGYSYHKKPELAYSQRRDIAITFMCTEHNNWKGAKNFCGSLPLDSDGEANKKVGE